MEDKTNENKKTVDSTATASPKRMKWSITPARIVNCTFPSGIVKSFPLSDLFPNVDKYNDAQLGVVAYGIRQNMADGYSAKKELALTEDEIRQGMTRKWDRWVKEGKFLSGERANAAVSKVDAFKEKVRAKAKELGISEEIAMKLLAV